VGAVAPTATFAATVASHSAQRNCLWLQGVRLYYRHRRHSLRALGAKHPDRLGLRNGERKSAARAEPFTEFGLGANFAFRIQVPRFPGLVWCSVEV